MRNRSTVYVAGPLFSLAERRFNTALADGLSKQMPHVAFILPQNHVNDICDQETFLREMFVYCLETIDKADAILAVLDGADVDSGTAVEIGYAYAKHKPIVGIRSDFRSLEDKGVNLMVSHVCKELVWLQKQPGGYGRIDIRDFCSLGACPEPQGL